MSKPRLIVETTTERVERTVRRVWVELPRPSRPTSVVPTTGEPIEDEWSGVHLALKPIRKATPRLAEIVPLFRKVSA